MKRPPESLKWLSGTWVKNKKKKVLLLKKTRQWRDSAGQPLTKSMEAKKRSWHVMELDKVFAKFIRERDKKNDCITKNVQTCKHKIEHCCHFISRWWYSHRWEEWNCRWWCSSCNAIHQAEHNTEYTMVMIEKYWHAFVREQLTKRHKKKPSIERLKEKILYYKSMIDG